MDVLELSKRAKRIAAIGQIVETFDTPSERISLVQALVDAHIISEFAADILLDEYAPGAAL
jgi:hypothetical protein